MNIVIVEILSQDMILRTSMSMHNDQENGKSIMTSHEIIDRDKGAKMLII